MLIISQFTQEILSSIKVLFCTLNRLIRTQVKIWWSYKYMEEMLSRVKYWKNWGKLIVLDKLSLVNSPGEH